MRVRLSAMLTLAGGVLLAGTAGTVTSKGAENPQPLENRIQKVNDKLNNDTVASAGSFQDNTGPQTRWWGPVIWANGGWPNWHNGWPNWGNGWHHHHHWHNWGNW